MTRGTQTSVKFLGVDVSVVLSFGTDLKCFASNGVRMTRLNVRYDALSEHKDFSTKGSLRLNSEDAQRRVAHLFQAAFVPEIATMWCG